MSSTNQLWNCFLKARKEKKASDMYHKIFVSSILHRKGYWKTAIAAASLAVVYWHQYQTIKHFLGMWSRNISPIHSSTAMLHGVCNYLWRIVVFPRKKTFWKFCLQNRKLGKSSPECSKVLFFLIKCTHNY